MSMVWHLQNRKVVQSVKTRKFLLGILVVCSLVVFISSCLLICAKAEESGYVAVDGNTVTEERLTDRVIEYDELGTLVHTGNPDIKEMTGTTEKNRQEYTEIRDYFLVEAGSAGEKEETRSYRSGVKTYNKMIESLDSNSSTKNRTNMEKQLVNAAQSLMISYESVSSQKEYFSKMEQLYSKLYSQMQLKQQSGMATAQEVESVRNMWLSMQASLLSAEGSEYSVAEGLFKLLGIEDGDSVQIARIPPVDTSRADTMNLEEDTGKALGNNLELSSARSTSSGKTTSSIAKKDRTVTELEQEIKISMEELYEQVLQAQTSYQAARTGMSGADLSWNLAGRKQQLGMLSETEYLEAEIAYLQKQNELRSAELNLLQAMEAYDWAVKGIM